jgi:hypothetical protein
MPISNSITPITVVQNITNNYTTEEITNVTEVRGNDVVFETKAPDAVPNRVGQLWVNLTTAEFWVATDVQTVANWLKLIDADNSIAEGSRVIMFGLESPYNLDLSDAQIGNIYFSTVTEDFYVLANLLPVRFITFTGSYLVPPNSTQFTNFLINVNTIHEGLGEFTGSTEDITFDPGEAILGEELAFYALKGTWMLWRSLAAQIITFSVEYLPEYQSTESFNLSILKGTYYDNFLEEYQHYYINGVSPNIDVLPDEIYAIRASISNNYPAKFKVTISEYQP